jgi:hypothetical protein
VTTTEARESSVRQVARHDTLWQRAPGAARVRVWQITSWGRGLRGGQPLPQGLVLWS